MAQLTESDRLFIAQRRARKHIGLFVMPGVLVVLIAVWVALFFFWPTAVNPATIWGANALRDCGSGCVSFYALAATILVNVAFTLLGAMLVLRIAWSRSERRYLKLLEKATLEPATGLARAPLPGAETRP